MIPSSRTGEHAHVDAPAAPRRVRCVSLRPWFLLPGVDEPGGCDDLTLDRVYEVVAVEAEGRFFRIIDDSGEDFLYPRALFDGDYGDDGDNGKHRG